MDTHFRLPIYAIWPFLIAAVALIAGLFLFDTLRYITCVPWTRLPASPRPGTQLVAAFSNKVFINDASGNVYCFARDGWNRCSYPTYNTQSEEQPDWVKPFIKPASIQEPIIDIHRNDNIVAISYYALTGSGAIYQCATNFQDEMNRIALSPSGLILLPPVIIFFIAIIAFLRIAVASGKPVYTDWDGNVRDY